MKTNMTIEQLAEKMNAKIWEKGNLKRIYLNDTGWNTKRMRTSTYIFKNEEDEFIVVCKIECASQGWNWIRSQQDEVKEHVYDQIRAAIDATPGVEAAPEAELPVSEALEALQALEPIAIEVNPHYNPRRTPVTHVANLAETPMLDYYHGCGKGIAYVRDDKVVAFQYDYEKYANAPEGCKRERVEFSCTQICFER